MSRAGWWVVVFVIWGAILAGAYYCGDGLGLNLTLNLKENGQYTAEWHGCLGKYGEASGTWSLKDKGISFSPLSEKDMMKGLLKRLDVMKHEGDWILAPTEGPAREDYEKSGVSRSNCFQKLEKIRLELQPFFAHVESQGIDRHDIVALWSFTITESPEILMDKALGKMPLPSDFLRDPASGLVDLPIRDDDSELRMRIKRDLRALDVKIDAKLETVTHNSLP